MPTTIHMQDGKEPRVRFLSGGPTRYLAEEHDVEDLSGQIRRTIESVDHSPWMLRADREWIEQRFDAAEQGRRLGAIYTGVIDRVR